MALEEQVVEKLIEKNLHISFAESCTGGMCCGTIINVANASKVLDVSFVTYANEAKIEFLGVKADTILSNGVVSKKWLAKWRRALRMRLKVMWASVSRALQVRAAAQLKSRLVWFASASAFAVKPPLILANLVKSVVTKCVNQAWNL